MWPFKPRPTRSSARPPDQRTTSTPVRPSARPPDFPSTCPPSPPDRPICPSAPPWPRPRVRALSAPSARPLHCPHPFRPRPLDHPWPPRPIRLSARPPDCVVSARPPVRSVHASSTTSARLIRHVHFVRARQPPLYIPHPASPQIIQLLAVRVGPRVSVAPLRTTALRGAQGLREVGVNCRGNPCNFFLAQQAAWRGRPFTFRETGLQQQLRVQDSSPVGGRRQELKPR